MKTVKAVFEEIEKSDELRKEIASVKDEASLEVFLKKLDFEGSVKEFVQYVKEQNDGSLSDDEVEAVAAGTGAPFDPFKGFEMYFNRF